MWEIDLLDQITTFALSLPVGGFFALLFYSMESFNRVDGNKGLRLFIGDILYFALIGFMSFCFLLVRTNGEIRGYAVIGVIVGFWLFKILFSKLYVMMVCWVYGGIKRLFLYLLRNINGLFLKIYRKSRKIFKKVLKTDKKRLKIEE